MKFFGGGEDTSSRNKELLEDFKVEKDVLDKFSEKKSVPKNVEEPKKVEIVKKPEEVKKAPVVKKPEVKKVKKEVIPKKLPEKKTTKRVALEPEKKAPEVKKNTAYPEKHPKKLINYDRQSAKYWEKFNPKLVIGEKAVYAIKYGVVSTGNISIETKPKTTIGDDEVFHIRARIKTSDYYSYLYELDDLCDSYVRTSDFIPLKFSLIQRESSQDIDDLQLFDLDKMKSYWFYKRVTKKKTRKKDKSRPLPKYFQDPLSIMYFIRGLPKDIGTKYTIPIINKGRVELLAAETEKKEIINTKLGKKEAYKVLITTKAKGKTIKGGNMVFWFATDESRIFLKFKAKISIGSISGDIIEYKR